MLQNRTGEGGLLPLPSCWWMHHFHEQTIEAIMPRSVSFPSARKWWLQKQREFNDIGPNFLRRLLSNWKRHPLHIFLLFSLILAFPCRKKLCESSASTRSGVRVDHFCSKMLVLLDSCGKNVWPEFGKEQESFGKVTNGTPRERASLHRQIYCIPHPLPIMKSLSYVLRRPPPPFRKKGRNLKSTRRKSTLKTRNFNSTENLFRTNKMAYS